MIRRPRPRRRSGLAEGVALAGGALGLALLVAQPAMAQAAKSLGAELEGLLLPVSEYIENVAPPEPGATGTLIEPPIGDRPTPAEAREAGLEDDILMRRHGGDATGGRPDVPVER